jgi:hypothetical protein
MDLQPKEPCFAIYFKAMSLLGRSKNILDLRDLKVNSPPSSECLVGENIYYDEDEQVPDELRDHVPHLLAGDVPQTIHEYLTRP